MSYAGVEIWSEVGDLLGFSVYQGSTCTVYDGVSETLDHAWAVHDGTAGRMAAWEADHSGHEDEPCIVFSDYGAGSYWPGRWCSICRVLTEGASEYELDYGYRQPSAEESEHWRKYHEAGWPKKGHPFPGQGGHYGGQFAEARS